MQSTRALVPCRQIMPKQRHRLFQAILPRICEQPKADSKPWQPRCPTLRGACVCRGWGGGVGPCTWSLPTVQVVAHVRYPQLQITFMMTVKNGASEGAASLSFQKCVLWDLNQHIAICTAWHEPLDQRTSAFCPGLRAVYCLEPCREKAHIQRKSSVTFFKSSANPASATQTSTAK